MCPRASRGSAGSRPTPSCALPTGPVPSAVPSTTLALASAPALRATMSPSHRKTRGAPTSSLRSTAPSAAATVSAAAPRPSLFAVARVSSLSFFPPPTLPHPHLLLLFSHNPILPPLPTERTRLSAPRARRSQPTRCTTRPSCPTSAHCSRVRAASVSKYPLPTRSTPRSPWASSASGSLSSSWLLLSPLLQTATPGTRARLTNPHDVPFDCHASP